MSDTVKINWGKLIQYAGIFFVVSAVILFFASIVIGFSKADEFQRQQREAWRQSPQNPINICIAKGGVPVTSAWDGELKNCQFPAGTVNR
jgi:hypothetical protein